MKIILEKYQRELESLKQKIDKEIEERKKDNWWSVCFLKKYGLRAVVPMHNGIDLLRDSVKNAIQELRDCPEGYTVSNLDDSILDLYLPKQFAAEYDLAFLLKFQKTINDLVEKFKENPEYSPGLIAEQLIIKIACDMNKDFEEAIYDDYGGSLVSDLCKSYDYIRDVINILKNYLDGDRRFWCDKYDLIVGFPEWMGNMFSVRKLKQWLYYGIEIDKDHPYHINNWFEQGDKNEY